MIFLLGEIWFWLLPAFLLGLGTGWWAFAQTSLSRIRGLELDLAAARQRVETETSVKVTQEGELKRLRAELAALKTAPPLAPAPEAVPEATLKPTPAPEPEPVETAPLAPPPPAAQEAPPEKMPTFLDRPIGDPDNLMLIKGIGKKLDAMLTSMGVFHFRQIAEWTPQEVAEVDSRLEIFKGRLERDQWQRQAALLASGDTATFEAEFGKTGTAK